MKKFYKVILASFTPISSTFAQSENTFTELQSFKVFHSLSGNLEKSPKFVNVTLEIWDGIHLMPHSLLFKTFVQTMSEKFDKGKSLNGICMKCLRLQSEKSSRKSLIRHQFPILFQIPRKNIPGRRKKQPVGLQGIHLSNFHKGVSKSPPKDFSCWLGGRKKGFTYISLWTGQRALISKWLFIYFPH